MIDHMEGDAKNPAGGGWIFCVTLFKIYSISFSMLATNQFPDDSLELHDKNLDEADLIFHGLFGGSAFRESLLHTGFKADVMKEVFFKEFTEFLVFIERHIFKN